MFKLSQFIIALIALLFSGVIVASEINNMQFSQFTKAHGLTDNVVTTIFQDKDGFIWFGTKGGVNKFDGYSFYNYRHIIDDSNSIIGNEIHDFLCTDNNELFIATHRGVSLYNANLNNFVACGYELKAGIKNVYTDNLVLSNAGEVIAFSANRVWLFNKASKRFASYEPLKAFTDNFYEKFGDGNVIYQDSRDKFWIGGQYGLVFCDTSPDKTNKLISRAIETINKYEPRVQYIYQASNSSMLVCTSVGLFVIDWGNEPQNALKHLIKEMDIVEVLVEDDNFILSTKGHGLVTYNRASGSVNKFMSVKGNPQSINDNNLKTTFRDIQGNLWIGTYESGINVSYKKIKGFNIIGYKEGNLNSLSSEQVKSLKVDNEGNIWFGVDAGINKYNPKTMQFEHHLHSTKNNSLPNAVLRIEATDEYIYAGGWATGLCRFNKETHEVKQFLFNPVLNHLNNYVRNMLYDSRGYLWVTSDGNGLQLFNEQTQTFKGFVQNADTSVNSIVSNSLTCLYEDSQKRIWIGGFGGVSILDTDTWKFTNLTKTDDANSLASDWVFAFLESSNGQMYIGTSEGMSIYNEQNNTYTNYTEIDGLVNNFVHALVEDNEGNIWIGTKNGLSKFNPSKKSFKNYHKQDGLHGNEISYCAYDKTKEGTIYLGGHGGVTYFNPNEIEYNTYIPKVVLTDLKINYQRVLPGIKNSPLVKDISQTNKLTLTHEQGIIKISFVAVNFINSTENLYSYKLEGFDTEYTKPGFTREATYTNLNPGDYVFKVKASNNDGIWNEQGVSLKITILPPWWKTWYFRIGLAVCLVVFIIMTYRIRVRALKEQKRVLEIKVKHRTEDLEMAYVELENKQNEIKQRNDELVTSEQELQQLNEELSTTNDQLYHQKEELETTLNNLKETQSQLVQSEKMASLGILTSGIAHEINNPLNFIQGGKTTLQLYLEENYPDRTEEFATFIDMIDEGINRAAKIVQGLNRFNRKTEDYNEECHIHDIVDNCLLMLHNIINYNILVKKEYARTNLIVIGNEGDLHQVFINILTNAAQSIENSGQITINTSIGSDFLIVNITDTGKGIAEENLKKVTAPFYTTKSPGEGTGLGMSIAYSIIKKHCGTIQYKSEIGKGTTVTLSFPIIK